MHAELVTAKAELRAFRSKAVWLQKLMNGGEVLFSLGDGSRTRRADAGGAFDLIYALRDTANDLDAQTTPTRAAFEANLDNDIMQQIEDNRLKENEKAVKLASKVIARFRSPAFIAAWKDKANPFEQLYIVEKLVEVIHLLDLYDPRLSLSGVASAETDRFLSDAAMGRPSIFAPDTIMSLIDDLPIEHLDDGTAQFKAGVTLKQASFLGKTSLKDLLVYTVRANAWVGAALTVTMQNGSGQSAQANALMAFYTKHMPEVVNIPALRALSTDGERLKLLGEIAEENNFRNVPPDTMGKIHKGISLGGVPFSLFAGLLKTVSSVQAIHDNPRSDRVVLASGKALGEASLLIGAALQTFGSKAVSTVAGKVCAVIAIPMLAYELVAVHNNITQAKRSGDLSVAFGQGLLGLAAVASTALSLYLAFCVATAPAGPAGLIISVATGVILGLTLLGLYLVSFTKDPDLETFASRCLFGTGFADSTKDKPGQISYKFGSPAKADCVAMIEKLYSLQSKLGFASEDTSFGSSGAFRLKHGAVKPDGTSVFPEGKLRVRYIGDGLAGLRDNPMPGYDEALFRSGAVSLLEDDFPLSRGHWFKMTLVLVPGNPRARIVEYAPMP